MKSDLTNIPEMIRETRDRALRYANAVGIAEQAELESQWAAAAELARDARGAALMTINSALMKTCAVYKHEHDATGYMDVDEEEPGPALHKHDCPRCQPLIALAKSINGVFGKLWAKTAGEDDMVSGEIARELHSGVIGQVYLAAFMSSRHVRQSS